MKRVWVVFLMVFAAFALTAHAAEVVGPESVRTVTVTVFCDQEDLSAKSQILTAFAEASSLFRREFEIEFSVEQILDWKPVYASKKGIDIRREFPEIQEFPRTTDLLVVFSRLPIYETHWGIFYPRRAQMIGYGSVSGDVLVKVDEGLGITLTHELGHVFGAEHSKEKGSIMFEKRSGAGPDFDPKNRQIIMENRDKKFSRFSWRPSPRTGVVFILKLLC